MAFDQKLIDGINYALNESEVAGFRLTDDRSSVDLLPHVLALPAMGRMTQIPAESSSSPIHLASKSSYNKVMDRKRTCDTSFGH